MDNLINTHAIIKGVVIVMLYRVEYYSIHCYKLYYYYVREIAYSIKQLSDV